MFARVARIRMRFEKAQDTWYCAEYEGSVPPSLADPSRDQDVKGLIIHHWIEHDAASSSSRLCSYWKSRQKFEDSQAVFERLLGLGEPLTQGYVRKFKIQRSPLWWRLTRGTLKALTGATALFGAWTALTTWIGPWWARPDIDVVIIDVPRRGIEGEEFEGAVKITNHGDYKVKVDLSPLRWTPAVDSPLDAPGWLVSVPKSEERTIHIAGTLPQARGSYSLGGEREAGSFRPDTKRVEHLVRVWPEKPYHEDSLATATPTRATVTGKIEVGPAAPKGLKCDFVVNGWREVQFDLTPGVFDDLDGRPITPPPSAPGGKPVAFLRWCTDELDEYSEPRFMIVMVADSPVDWKKVVAGTKLKCSIRRNDQC